MTTTITLRDKKDILEHFWKFHCKQQNLGSMPHIMYFALRAACTQSPEQAFDKYMRAHFQPSTSERRLNATLDVGSERKPYRAGEDALHYARQAMNVWVQRDKNKIVFDRWNRDTFVSSVYQILDEDLAVAARTLLTNFSFT